MAARRGDLSKAQGAVAAPGNVKAQLTRTSPVSPVPRRSHLPDSDTAAAYRLVKSVSHACRILEAFIEIGPEVGANEMGRHLHISVSVVFRIMKTMTDFGFLQQDPSSRRFRVGPRALEVGLQYARGQAFAAAAIQAVQHALPAHTCFVGVLKGDVVFTLGAAEGAGPIKIGTREVGDRIQAHSTGLGKALLAELPEKQVVRMMERAGMPASTSHTMTTPKQLLADLARTRLRGYAVSDEEAFDGVIAVGVAVHDSVRLAGAISVSIPKFILREGDLEAIGATLKHVSHELEAGLAQNSSQA